MEVVRRDSRGREQRRQMSSLPPPRIAFRQQQPRPAKRTYQPSEGDRPAITPRRRGEDVADAFGVVDQKGVEAENPASGVKLFERTVRPDAHAAAAHLQQQPPCGEIAGMDLGRRRFNQIRHVAPRLGLVKLGYERSKGL